MMNRSGSLRDLERPFPKIMCTIHEIRYSEFGQNDIYVKMINFSKD